VDKAGAAGGIESVKQNAHDDTRYERNEAKEGQHFFNLLASNGQVIGTSEMYKATASMEKRDAEGKRRTFGLKFFRLQDDPWANLRKIDGPDAPRVVAPGPFAAPGFAPEHSQARR